MNDKSEILLSRFKAGQTVKFVGLNAGNDLKSRLAALGMVPNVNITVVRNGNPGPFVVSIKGSKIVLGRGMAEKVIVEQVGSRE